MFSVRIAGNVVNADVLASLEYACKNLGTKTVVVLGHTQCGAVAAACGDPAEWDGHLPILMQRILPATKAADPVTANVKLQLQYLRMSFAKSLKGIELVGAVFDLASGKVQFL